MNIVNTPPGASGPVGSGRPAPMFDLQATAPASPNGDGRRRGEGFIPPGAFVVEG